MPTYTPTTPDGIVELCLSHVAARDGRVVVVIDGADAARPDDLADRLADRLRAVGRAAGVVRMSDYLRAASLRFEYGHTDPESYRSGWFDHQALDREVVSALRVAGRWLPRLWDAEQDRSFRDRRQDAAPDQVLILAGPMLVGRDLDVDLTIRLRMSEATLRRISPPDTAWTIEPILRYSEASGDADIEVRYDHPDRPAVAVNDPRTRRHRDRTS
ncbi:hypothetical protein [Gordonia sp. SL306]|uniref:hypothetical protein n=1 Tax=Gordonia sp. SL306 TaxID=2995145 RepID=UPI0022709CFC|nr:hypothetical protein [Gordonia sp. SL306]WAC55278.1 hypothetical protein OVA31_22155 [Gordonia sp. SL306]